MKTWTAEGLRYVVVGASSNLALYCAYLFLTRIGVAPKAAMTSLYFVGVLQTFYFQKRWTFAHDGHIATSLTRYIIAYALCYLGNLATLYLFVDRLGWRHEIIQGGAILGFALALFILQRFWVFRSGSTSSPSARSEI